MFLAFANKAVKLKPLEVKVQLYMYVFYYCRLFLPQIPNEFAVLTGNDYSLLNYFIL